MCGVELSARLYAVHIAYQVRREVSQPRDEMHFELALPRPIAVKLSVSRSPAHNMESTFTFHFISVNSCYRRRYALGANEE